MKKTKKIVFECVSNNIEWRVTQYDEYFEVQYKVPYKDRMLWEYLRYPNGNGRKFDTVGSAKAAIQKFKNEKDY